MKLDKKTMYIGGGALILIAAYLWYRNRSSTAATTTDTTGTTQDQGSADYAALAGDLQAAGAQEGTDFQNLQSQLGAIASGELTTDQVNALIAAALQAAGLGSGSGNGSSSSTTGPAGPGSPAPARSPRAGKHQASQGAGQTKGDKNTDGKTHAKGGQKNKPHTGNPHQSASHPFGTGGSAVGQRSHAPARATTSKPGAPSVNTALRSGAGRRGAASKPATGSRRGNRKGH